MSADSMKQELQEWATGIALAIFLTAMFTGVLVVIPRIWPHERPIHAQAKSVVNTVDTPKIDARLKQIEMRLTQVQSAQLQREKGDSR